ncbi:hypothetical protein LR004_02870 [Candidatus Gracilibacteria bacterium]|nr:hypothetical protein [Candidatus Gracilibacteria bacterium]
MIFKEKKSSKVHVEHSVENKALKCRIIFANSEMYGKKVNFGIISKVQVIDGSAVNTQKTIFKHTFVVQSSTEDIIVDMSKYKNFSYNGTNINIVLFSELVIDDAIIFDTKITKQIESSLFIKPKVSSNSELIINPKDSFNLIENIKAVSTDSMIKLFGLSLLGGVVILVNMLVGIHDQFTIESQTYLYSHHDSDGDANSPLVDALIGSGALGIFVWRMMKKQLRKYMSFGIRKIKFLGTRDKKYKIRDIVKGKSRVDLKNIELRIVACNMEKGQYIRGSGSNRRTVSFVEPIRAVSLYSKKIDFIPRNVDVGEYLDGEVSFEKMYKSLYPEQRVSETHGLTVHWEIQLLHKKFIDQELIGDANYFIYKYFLQG